MPARCEAVQVSFLAIPAWVGSGTIRLFGRSCLLFIAAGSASTLCWKADPQTLLMQWPGRPNCYR